MWQVVGMLCLGRRGGEMGDGGFVLYLVLRMGDRGVSGRSWVEVRSFGGGSRIGLGRSMTRVILIFPSWCKCVVDVDTDGVLVWLVVVMSDRRGLGFGLGDDLLRPALKISADGCCGRLECGGCEVG